MANSPANLPDDAPFAGPREGGTGAVKLVYLLYLCSLLVGVTALIGVVVAYVYDGDGPEWLRSHYRFQIRTFWIGLLFVAVCVVTSLILIGYFLGIVLALWLIVRCVRGLKYASRSAPYPNPASWMFG